MRPRSRSSSPRISLPWTVRSGGSSVPSYEVPCAHAPDASALRQSTVGEHHETLLAVRLGEAGRGRKEGEGGRRKGREKKGEGEGGRRKGREKEGEERGGRKKEEEGGRRGEENEGRKKRREEGKGSKYMCKTET